MRTRYYNPDIKRFINQDIKTGDIGNSQSLNRYAYCEGNPVNMVDPFRLCGENTNDQGQKSRYQWLHNALDWSGLVFDGADIVNGVFYAAEGDYVNAVISFACGIPAVGTVVTGIAKATKAVKAIKTAQKITDACRTVAKIGNAAAGLVIGASVKWAAGKVKSLASKALPKLKTAVQEGAEKFVGRLRKGFASSGPGRMNRNRGFVINPFYKGGKTKDIYRAVGVEEYEDIISTGKFRGIEGKTLAAKQFGNDFNETLQFANKSINRDKVAIIKVTIPQDVYNQLNHMNLDVSIFKSGTPVVEPDMLDFFNDSIINIEHFY